MAEPLEVIRPARAPLPLAVIAVFWTIGLAAIALIDAAPVIIGIMLLFTLPAIWDALRGRVSRLTLTDTRLSWSNGRAEGDIPLERIDAIRLHTGLDFSQRARITLKTGEKTRIPPDCLPSGRRLDTALAARGIAHSRSLFAL